MNKTFALVATACSFLTGCYKNISLSTGVTNGSFEYTETADGTAISGWQGTDGTISSDPRYNPVDGQNFFLLPGNSKWLSQITTTTIEAGKAYALTLYASNGNAVGNNSTPSIAVELFSGETLIDGVDVNVAQTTTSALHLEATTTKTHQLNENHTYVPIEIKFFSDDYPQLEGDLIGVRIRNSGEESSLLAIDSIDLRPY